ncbi:SDR family oxidoreductase [Nocardia sp. NPDC059240]|uniref:SDR family oxidoreductase n=1 Tax=Nocardia sp. NPDC059240 TaxID=3346786 RepID=UPI00368A0DDD
MSKEKPKMPRRANIVITGASSGLGAQMAREFAARGRNLALCARRLDRLEQLRDELLRSHPGIEVVIAQLDVNDHDQVFTTFRRFERELGGLDRVIVNAGMGKGEPIGTGRFEANLRTANTNFIAALAQCEAAMEIFRAQNSGHLVVISSISALRGMPGYLSIYSATKAGVATLAEAIRADTLLSPIAVTTLYPGYIESELSARVGATPLMASTASGVRAMVKAIEHEKAEAKVPAWPWIPIGFALRHLPLWILARSA